MGGMMSFYPLSGGAGNPSSGTGVRRRSHERDQGEDAFVRAAGKDLRADQSAKGAAPFGDQRTTAEGRATLLSLGTAQQKTGHA